VKTKRNGSGLDARLAKSVSHPIRIDALRILRARAASPSELAEELGEGVSHVSYHIQELYDHGCIELVETEPRRGTVKHYYRAISECFVSDEEAREQPKESREEVSAMVLEGIIGEAVGALRTGSFDARADRHASWRPMNLDEEGWGEVTAMLWETLKKAEEIQDKCDNRLSRNGDEGTPAIVSLLGFERSEGLEA
jgi:DNA-binding transcriptional ArsR family regulator